MAGEKKREWPRAETIVKGLGGHWMGNYAMCKCPVHKDSKASLSVRRGVGRVVLLHCFANCDFFAIRAALVERGLWPRGDDTPVPVHVGRHPSIRIGGVTVAESMQNRQRAQEVWDESRPIKGTTADAYLRTTRGINLPLPAELRYDPRCYNSETKCPMEALVARISDDKGFVGVQRTYLDGPKKAQLKMAKKTLGRMFGGAVRLWMPTDDTLGLAEGIETALSCRQLYSVPTWAVLGIERFALVEIPKSVHNLIIFGDEGEVGHRKAFEAQDRWQHRGVHCEVIFPRAHFEDATDDFNTVLKGAGA